MAGSASVRRLPNWITSFIRETENLESPEIFRKWAAIGVLSAVLERRVWSRTKGSNLYPNTYIVLVGPPGVGKSAIVSHAENMVRSIEELFVAPSSVTSASLVDSMALAMRKVFNPTLVQYNSLQVFSSELQNFLPEYEASIMGMLTKLYDCELYEERRRTGKTQHTKIDHTQLSILAGTTPSYLNALLPETAWDQGFTSRTLLVFCDDSNKAPIFDEPDREYNEQLYKDLVLDLRAIMTYYKQITWTEKAQHLISEWDKAKGPPRPEHNRLKHYTSRRTAHLLKLSMIACVARGDTELKVTDADYTVALDWLLQAEALIPDIFKNMVVTGEARVMQDAHFYLLQIHSNTGKPVPEHYLVNFLKDRIPSQSIAKVMETMVRAQMLKQEFNSPVPCYTPLRRNA